MKKFLSLLLCVAFVISVFAPLSVSADEYCDANIQNAVVHDPSIIKAENGKYYVVGSHMAMYESDDLVNWTQLPSSLEGSGYLGEDWKTTLEVPLEWTTSWQEWLNLSKEEKDDIQYNCWANDVIYNKAMGKYCLYGCVSVWGTTCSAIWLCTSDSIEGPYEYSHTFIYSGISKFTNPDNVKYIGLPYDKTNIQTDLIDKKLLKRTDVLNMPWFNQDEKMWYYGHYACGYGEYPNAIDPTPFADKDGNMWLVYGSYSGGCFVIKLDNSTGLPDYEYMKKTAGYDIYYGKRISNTNAETEGTGEGPYIQYDPVSDYYYFYLTYGGLSCTDGYNLREYRSKNPDGPYEDAEGNLATDFKNTGLKLVGSYKFSSLKNAYISGGHGSCLVDDDNSMYHAYHTRYLNYDGADFGNAFKTVIHKMARTADGWAVLLPFQYQNEAETTAVTRSEVVGAYEFVDSTNETQRTSYGKDLFDTVYPTQTITLNDDGTIGYVKHYDYVNKEIKVGDETEISKEYAEKRVSGSWTLENGTVNATFKIGNVTYNGVFAKQFDETADKNEVLVFTAAGNNNTTIWGVKDNSHSFVLSKSTKASCTASGCNIYTCSDCGINLTRNYKSKTAHSYSKTVVKPTCTKDGYTKHTCKGCGSSYTDNKTAATGHKYDSGKVTKKATYAKAGVKTYTCTKCGATKTKSIARLTLAKPASVKASALSKGFKLSWKKVSASKGYEIQYSLSSKFTSPKKVTIKKNSTVSKSVKKLKANKKYYVRIRAYVTENGKKYYSGWVTVSVKTKK